MSYSGSQSEPQSSSLSGEMKTVTQAYQALVDKGDLDEDPIQLALAGKLDELRTRLDEHASGSKSSALGWLLGAKRKPDDIRGLYIWGGVGRGKSMMMDMFFSSLETADKRRVHFHDFMADAHDRISAHRKAYSEGSVREEDPMPIVAQALANEAEILCFDEFSVSDIADAMILGRLFSGIFAAGSVVVATSNIAPGELYKDGLNRQLFLPFIDLLQRHCEVFELDGGRDYRMEKLAGQNSYLAPLNDNTRKAVNEAWVALGGKQEKSETLEIKGRKLKITRAAGRAARFDFSELCEAPLAARDYLVLAQKYDTIIVENVPMMDSGGRNVAKRFINLVDALYDNKVRLIMSAAASAHALYSDAHSREGFEFDRTASRLIEMQSDDYLQSLS